jgi:predicted RNA binding protein YcfA (HicA-like mRNA interferase family)
MSALRGIKPRDYRDVIQAAVEQGWSLSHTGGGHLRLDPPDGTTPVFCATSSGGGRGERNLRSLLRKRGVTC